MAASLAAARPPDPPPITTRSKCAAAGVEEGAEADMAEAAAAGGWGERTGQTGAAGLAVVWSARVR